MFARLTAVMVLALVPLSVHAADDDNPYKNVKVGDYVVYKMDVKVGDFAITGTTTQTVTAKTATEATITVVAKVNGMDTPPQTQKIDLTKPYDPTKATNLPAGTDGKIEKLKDGKEKIKVGGKDYDCTWTTYRVKAKVMGNDISSDLKVWMSKDIPMGTAKMEMLAEIAGMKMEMKMELSESGNKK